jgi:tRNA(fMet)-specific endonuclease VapC
VSYLLDTDILSNLLRRAPSTALIARLGTVPSDQQFTSSITLGELHYGARRLRDRAENLLARIEALAAIRGVILPFDTDAARQYGSLRAELESRGTPIGDADLRIAAIALTRGLVVVTANTRHFARVPGLSVENWLA